MVTTVILHYRRDPGNGDHVILHYRRDLGNGDHVILHYRRDPGNGDHRYTSSKSFAERRFFNRPLFSLGKL
jgi:hypothetical protein